MRRLLALALALLVLGAPAALAHATLVGSEPADGATLGTAPATFVLDFNEPVSPLVLRLVGGDGGEIALDRWRLAGDDVVVEAPARLADGRYALSWRVVSEDGHPVGGTVLFAVGDAPAAGPPLAVAAADGRIVGAIIAARVVIYLGLFLGIGGLFFHAFAGRAPETALRLQTGLLVAALVALPVSVGLQGLDALGLPPDGIADPAAWRAGLATSYGPAAAIAVVAVLVALAGLRAGGRASRLAAPVALAGAGLALASTGHASAAGPEWATRPAVFVHGVTVAVWAGALLPLGLLLREGQGAVALRRFSRWIPVALVPLVAAGAFLALVQVGRPAALLATDYGRVLLAKLALVALLLGLAALNRWRLTAPALAGGPAATRRLARSVAAEVAIVVAILGVVSLWRFTPPPRSLAVAAAPVSLHLHGAKAMADVTITPGRAGPATVAIVVRAPDFGVPDAREVTLTLAKPEAGIEPIRRKAVARDGTWRVEAVTFPVAGTWRVKVAVLVTDFDLATLEGTVTIAP